MKDRALREARVEAERMLEATVLLWLPMVIC